jgi:hypothetical protein
MNYTKINMADHNGVEVEDLPSWGAIDTSGFTKFRRAPFSNGRFYFNSVDPFFYSGLTNPLGRVMDKRHLHAAAIRAAYEGRDTQFEWEVAANYGTMFHLLVGLHEEGALQFSFENADWEGVLDSFVEEYRYYDFRRVWRDQVRNDFAAYFQWKKDFSVRVLSTEVMVSDRQNAVATPLDIICEMMFGRKKIYANVNIKTGDHAFTEDNLLQIACEAHLWNKTEGKPFSLSGSFCWRPKKRNRTPGAYEMSKNMCLKTDTELTARIEYVLYSAKLLGLNKPSGNIVRYHGDQNEWRVEKLTPAQWLQEWQSLGL